MIIKKPYAFIVKHFRIIHLLMLVPMVFLALNFGDIASFLRKYTDNMMTPEANVAGTYITLFTYLAIIVLLVVNITILSLMKSKKKSYKYYLANSIYYTILLALSLIYYITLQTIDKGSINDTLVEFVSGISLASVIPSYILIIATLFQASGFNIKTMKFDKALDLQISDDDSEDIEVGFIKGNGEAKKNLVHLAREMKYYLLENKEIFTLVSVIIGLVAAISLYLHFGVYNKRYNLNQAFALDYFSMTVKESYISNVDYSGRYIADEKYYLVVKIAIHNKTPKAHSINKDNFRLYYDNKAIYPNYDRSARFIDYGKNYQGGYIQGETTDDYVLVYELDEKMIKSKYQMKILSSLKKEPGKLIPSYKTINIKPKNIVQPSNLKDAGVGDTIDFKETTLANTEVTLKKISYSNRYVYYYNQCGEKEKCMSRKSSISASSGKIFLIIEDSIKWDESTPYYKNGDRDFYEDFVTIEYTYTKDGVGKKYTTEMKNVTPQVVNNVKIYEVNSLLQYGTDVKFYVKVRNKRFNIKIGSIGELKQQ